MFSEFISGKTIHSSRNAVFKGPFIHQLTEGKHCQTKRRNSKTTTRKRPTLIYPHNRITSKAIKGLSTTPCPTNSSQSPLHISLIMHNPSPHANSSPSPDILRAPPLLHNDRPAPPIAARALPRTRNINNSAAANRPCHRPRHLSIRSARWCAAMAMTVVMMVNPDRPWSDDDVALFFVVALSVA